MTWRRIQFVQFYMLGTFVIKVSSPRKPPLAVFYLCNKTSAITNETLPFRKSIGISCSMADRKLEISIETQPHLSSIHQVVKLIIITMMIKRIIKIVNYNMCNKISHYDTTSSADN